MREIGSSGRCPSPAARFVVTSFNRMGLWIEREFGIARVEFAQVGAPKRSDLPQREFAAYTLTVGAMTHLGSRLPLSLPWCMTLCAVHAVWVSSGILELPMTAFNLGFASSGPFLRRRIDEGAWLGPRARQYCHGVHRLAIPHRAHELRVMHQGPAFAHQVQMRGGRLHTKYNFLPAKPHGPS